MIQVALYFGTAQSQTLTGISFLQACLHMSLFIKASREAAELQSQLFPISVANITLLLQETGAPRVGLIKFGAAQKHNQLQLLFQSLGKAQSQGESFFQPQIKLLKKNSSYNPCKNLFIW